MDDGEDVGPSTFWMSAMYKVPERAYTEGRDVLEERMEWPSQTDIACWHCTYPFEWCPVPIPTAYNPNTGEFTPFGVFCSLECAKRYILQHPSSSSPSEMKNLSIMAREVFGYTRCIHPAPVHYALRRFGGYMTIEEFRARSGRVEVTAHTPPFLNSTMIFEEQTIAQRVKEIERQKMEERGEKPFAISIVHGSRPTKNRWQPRGLRAPQKSQESASNSATRISQTTPLYEEFLQRMRREQQGSEPPAPPDKAAPKKTAAEPKKKRSKPAAAAKPEPAAKPEEPPKKSKRKSAPKDPSSDPPAKKKKKTN